MNQLCLNRVKDGQKVFRFGFGQSPFPVPEIIVNALKDNAHQKGYLDASGLFELRKEVASCMQDQFTYHITSDNVLIGPGSKELIFHTQLALKRKLLLPSPSWVSYVPQAQLLGLEYHWINTHYDNRWCLTASDLDRFCSSYSCSNALLILNYPNNPSGTSYKKEDLSDLASVARHHNLIVVSDEIYGGLTYNSAHRSIANFYPEGTVVCTGLSKWCGAGGWRLGTMVFPEELMWLKEKLVTIASESFSSVSSPIQYAAIKAFSCDPSIVQYVKDENWILKHISEYVHNRLVDHNIMNIKSDGGFYCFPDFSDKAALRSNGIDSSRQFTSLLLQDTGVALLPGADFGRPENELTARLAFVDFDGEIILRDINEIKKSDQWLPSYCPQIVEGMDRLLDWTN